MASMMQIDVSPEIAEMRQTVRAFVKNELPRWADAVDELGDFPAGVIEAFARQGFLGMRIAEEYGGAGLELAHYCMVQEEISRAHTMFSLLMSASGGLAPMAIQRHGTEAQKRKYLPLLTSGKARTSFALTESEAGSDSASIRTRAEQRPDGRWALNGMKHFISCADVTDLIMVVAVTDPAKRNRGGFTAFLVERGTPGMQVTRVDHTMGSAAWTLAELTFSDCVVPADAVVGAVGRGFNLAMESLNEGRLSIASICLGAADRLLELATEHAKTRRTFGAPLAERQAIQWMLADSATEIMAARSMLTTTLRELSAGREIGAGASMCKLYCSEMAGRVADRAIQIHGASGLMRGSPIERSFRDLRLFRVGEGTSEVQRMVIARNLLGS
jgi:alkylation response protein AidB-like acyl-CoA dehydrogenase